VVVSTFYLLPSGESYIESKRLRVIDGDDEWILQYDILNQNEIEKQYTIDVTVDSAVYHDRTVVGRGKTYTYIFHILPEQLTEGNVGFTVYEQGKAEPVDQVTYYIVRD
jgi:hypothetical protein